MSNVKIFLTEGFEEMEFISIIDILRRAKIEIKSVSLLSELKVSGAHKVEIIADELFNSVNFDDTDMIILPGGPGTKNFKKHEGLNKLITEFVKQNKYVAAICAAPSVLGELGLLEGKRAVCYPGFEKALKGAVTGENRVEFDGNIITSRGPGTAAEFALKLVEIIKNKELAKKLATAMLI